MPLFFVCESLKALRDVTCSTDLPLLMEAVTADLGFSYYALVDHVDPRNSNGSSVFITNYPEFWVEYFLETSLFLTDPVLAACRRTHLGFCWSDLTRFIPLSRRQLDILEGGLVTDLRRSPERLELATGDRRDDQAYRRVQA